mmetsp:Transcript_34212/g.59848  ORF Transcript_34212/g.59848 Transcript_34212/m.59848 type:complete len:542 (-) Transcript_34212:1905-3530(-)
MADWFSSLTAKGPALPGSDPCGSDHAGCSHGPAAPIDKEKRVAAEAKETLVRRFLDDLKAGNHTTIVQAVIEGKIEYDFKTPEGFTAIHEAVLVSDVASVKKLLNEASCPVDLKAANGLTPLMYSVMKGNLQLVKLFLDRGADIEAKDQSGMTPLLIASQHGQLTAYIVLRHRGADVTATDINGCTAAHWAAFHNHPSFLRMLKSFNMNLEAKDSTDMTPLHRACSSNAVDSIDFLLRNGANTAAKTKEGKTPIEVAKDGNYMAGQLCFLTQTYEGSDTFAKSFKYLFYAFWLMLYVTYISYVLPYTAHYFFTSLAFNLAMIVLPISSLLTLCSQSGELARQADSPEVGVISSIGETFEAENFKDIVDAHYICFTCFLKRPQRSKHCRLCNKCIPRQDHHCHFIGKCIGEHNHRRFFSSLALTYLSLILFLYLSLQLFSAHITDPDLSSIVAQTVIKIFETADISVLVAAACIPLAWYSGWYLYLEVHSISQGLTVNEVVNRFRYRYLYTQVTHPHKGKQMRFTNPFSRGLIGNWTEFWSA